MAEPQEAIVVDAALVAKWLLPEELSERAHALLAGAVAAGQPIYAPRAISLDIASAVHAHARRDDLTVAEAEAAVDLLVDLDLTMIEPPGLWSATLAFARAHQLRYLHDAQAVTLARLLGADCWTGNRALHQTLAPLAPWVRWIGDYSSSQE